ncbi:MAG: PAS domain S-box protein [bacterium]
MTLKAKLQESEILYRRLVELSPEGVAIYSGGKIVFANGAAANLLGATSPEELAGQPLMGFIHSSSQKSFSERAEKMLAEGIPMPSAEETFVRLDGASILLETAATPLNYKDHPAIMLLVRDISGLRESENRLRLIFNSTVNVMIQLNNEGEIIDINDKGLSFLAEDKNNVVGKNLAAFSHFFTEGSLELILKKFAAKDIGQGVKPYVVEANDKNGRQLFFELSAAILSDQNNNVTGELIVLHDITENLRFMEKIKEKNQELEQLYKIKSDFTTSITHELRTPLTPLKEGIGLILDETMGPLNEKQKHLLSLAKRNIDRLYRLIINILDFAKLEQSKMTFNLQENDLLRIIKECAESLNGTFDSRGLYLRTDLPADLPAFNFDSDRITQVIFNLLDNALKFTEKGGDHCHPYPSSEATNGRGLRGGYRQRFFQQRPGAGI